MFCEVLIKIVRKAQKVKEAVDIHNVKNM